MALEPSTPPVNIYEGSGQLSVVVPIPGAHRDHTELVVGPDRLRVRAICKYAQDGQKFHRRDWQVGAWEADVALPRRIAPAGAHARLNLGVLVVMAPMSESGSGEARPRVE
ncbi:MAG: Hsp20/alpha crystallin family protein [Candidatus Dormibacteraceae bacterium]